MTKNLNWTDLLTVAGFLPEEKEDGNFRLMENLPNMDFLRDLLDETGLRYDLNRMELGIKEMPPTMDAWMEILRKTAQKGTEMLYEAEELELVTVDAVMLGLVRQLNRLGLKTCYSCEGHGARKPRLQFSNRFNLERARVLFRELRYPVSANGRGNALDFNIKAERLPRLALELSKLEKITAQGIRRIREERHEELLEELLMIPGKSGDEERIRSHVFPLVEELTDRAWVDEAGNILAEKQFGRGPTLMLSAHMDMYEDIDEDSRILKEEGVWRRDRGILGADDRAGVAMILSVLSELDRRAFRGTIKVALTVEEEIGQKGAEEIDRTFFETVDFAISLDRKNGSDIVIESHGMRYGSREFGELLESVSVNMGHWREPFRAVEGGRSDLRVWSASGIESANLSIGYYEEHTEAEYLNLLEWHRTLGYLKACLERLSSRRPLNACGRETREKTKVPYQRKNWK